MNLSNNPTEEALAHLRRLHLGQVAIPTEEDLARCDLALRNYRALLENGVVRPAEIFTIADPAALDAFERQLADRLEQL
jgi:hypothetical protein